MAVVASAPGKVLLTGAYLVLERPNAGLVLSTSARFFAIVKPVYSTLPEDSWAWSWIDVAVISPQLSKESTYKFSLKDFSLRKVSPVNEEGNSFVERALQLAVVAAYIAHEKSGKRKEFKQLLLQGMEVSILGSNDFYSYRKHIEAKGLPLMSSTLASLPRFSPITFNSANDSSGLMLPEVAKTGLGSSAAMTSAVVGALLHYLQIVRLPCSDEKFRHDSGKEDLDLVHAISQAAHSLAQGKIGSGFDVSAAVFGSQRYVRFSPTLLSVVQQGTMYLSFTDVVQTLINGKWDAERLEYALPPLLQLIIGEPGFGGSHTPSMVGAIQTWRKTQPQEAQILWSNLQQSNTNVENGLLKLKTIAKEHIDEYKSAINVCEQESAEQWPRQAAGSIHAKVAELLSETRHAFQSVRLLLRQMGEAAGVPVEPPPQSALLDATMEMKGMLFAGVPGAGGYDAVFAITLGDAARALVEEQWSARGVLALCVVEDPRGVRLEKDDPRQDGITGKMIELNLEN